MILDRPRPITDAALASRPFAVAVPDARDVAEAARGSAEPARGVPLTDPAHPAHPQLRYCFDALPTVSRTFALNIRILPRPLRASVTVAYLLFRLADTVEDTAGLPAEDRLALFDGLAADLAAEDGGDRFGGSAMQRLIACEMPDGERALLLLRGCVLATYASLPATTRAVLRRWLDESISGMRAVRPPGTPQRPECLETRADLDRYCWYVAGTVGMMLTELFAEYSPAIDAAGRRDLLADAEAFGRGLQLTNILQDVAGDLSAGRVWLPRVWLAESGVDPADVLRPSARSAVLGVVRRVAEGALTDLTRSLRYACRLPGSEVRLRVFCLWPMLAALRTLGRVVRGGPEVLSAGRRPKILRRRLFTDMAAAALWARWPARMTGQFAGIVRTEFPHGWRRGWDSVLSDGREMSI